MIWNLIHIIDILLWLFMAGSVGYVSFFALVSVIKRKEKTDSVLRSTLLPHSHFLVLIPAYKEDSVILSTVETFLKQDYPSSHFQLTVISDHMQQSTNAKLAALPIRLLQPDFEKSSKAKALQYAIQQAETAYTHVVILDADNHVGPDFLTRLDIICQKGYQAIQCHRTAKNDNNDIAVLDGLSEEINNTLFRRAHNNIGMSSALIGSGMCFGYEWFCKNVSHLNSAVEDRELEALLLRQNIYVKYVDTILIMDEKVSNSDNFQRQRLRWMTGQLQALQHMLPYVPRAIATGNINYLDKTVQQMLIPRSILLVITPIMALGMTLLAFTWSPKWWAMLLCLCLSIYIAIPKQMRTHATFGKLTALPMLVWRMLKNLSHIDRKNKEFIHTTHNT